MAHPRTPINELQLAGSPNLRRALAREKADATVTLTPDQRSEIDKLSELIAQTMRACRKGSTVRGRPNAAFQQLHALVRTRELLLKGRKPSSKSAADVLAEAEKLLGAN